MGMHEESEKMFLSLLDQIGDQWDVYHHLGLLAMQNGNFEKVKACSLSLKRGG